MIIKVTAQIINTNLYIYQNLIVPSLCYIVRWDNLKIYIYKLTYIFHCILYSSKIYQVCAYVPYNMKTENQLMYFGLIGFFFLDFQFSRFLIAACKTWNCCFSILFAGRYQTNIFLTCKEYGTLLINFSRMCYNEIFCISWLCSTNFLLKRK